MTPDQTELVLFAGGCALLGSILAGAFGASWATTAAVCGISAVCGVILWALE